MPSDARLYLDLQISTGPPEVSLTILAAALSAGPIASVLIRPDPADQIDVKVLRAIISLVQSKGVATFLSDDAQLAGRLDADGTHLSWSNDVVQRYKLARQAAAAGAMIGADAGRTRHDAMELAEGGADYVAFGIPAHVQDRERAAERQLDLVSWWSELFEVPCVAFDVATADEARQLAEAGADFIALTVSSSEDAREVARSVREFLDALRVHERAR